MPFESIRTFGFRNLADAEVRTDAREVFLVGENGQGKTNFLEAVYFCSFASSFRSSRDADLVRSGSADCSALARLSGSPVDKILVKLESGRKVVLLDDKKTEDRKALLDVAPSIVFCHEDMEFVSGPPERRRWFFDQCLSLCGGGYLDELRKYRKILKTRNALLKERKTGVLEFVDVQLAESGLSLMASRSEAATSFSSIFRPLFEKVSGIADVGVRYAPSWKSRATDQVAETLAAKREVDLSFGTTLSGPHRDRYVFEREGAEFAGKASTGQRRLLALLLRACQALLFARSTGRRPVLLLDDVLLELDPAKRERFLDSLPDYDQAFFTFLPGEPVERYGGGGTRILRVEDGTIRP